MIPHAPRFVDRTCPGRAIALRLIARGSLWTLLGLSAAALAPQVAEAWVIQIPANAELATLPQGRVLCGQVPEGFIVDSARRRIRPKADSPPGLLVNVALAQQPSACTAEQHEPATLIVTGDHPSIDLTSVTLALDAGRLDLSGDSLEGLRIGWSADGKTGSDVCLSVTGEKDTEECALNIDKALPADPQRIELRWAPAFGRIGPGVVTYDARGEPLPEDLIRVPVARVLISRMFPDAAIVNVASGEGRVQLVHPEAVSGVECGAVRCDTTPDGLVVGAVPAAAPSFSVRLRLLPKVFIVRGEALENAVTQRLTVLRCPMSLTSGAPLRNADELRVLVNLSAECVGDVSRLRWTANGDPAEVLLVESEDDDVYVLLRLSRTASDRLVIAASREDGSVLGVISSPTAELPPLMASIALPNYGDIQFIPRNRDAVISIAHVGGKGRLEPVSVPGAYTVTRLEDGFHIRGVNGAGGFAALSFAYRIAGLPESFRSINFALVNDSVQRPIREASVPVPIGGSSMTDRPVIELYCAERAGELKRIAPGVSTHIPYDQRDSCRLVIHRERIEPEAGEQRVDIEVNVVAVGGIVREDARVTHRLVLRHGPDRDVIWLRGARAQFDRFSIQATHIVNEALLMTEAGSRMALPSAQWVVVTEDADLKFYATATIPASLYRFSSDEGDAGSGPLSLNFGVLSRLTWLDSEGHEGLVGIEAGVMGMGLASDVERQLAIVAGLGIAIPLGNANQPAQAAINIHAWGAYSIGKQTARLDDGRNIPLSHWAFVFGPSITVGSIGAFL